MASKRRSLSQVKNCGRKRERRQPVLQEYGSIVKKQQQIQQLKHKSL
jgi:hypothetical protein